MVSPLHTKTAQDLMTEPIEERPMLIDQLMGDGLGFLVASPKTGKSWLAMHISICVATGTSLWGYPVRKGAVLHLPLEDTYQRITKRLWKLIDEIDGCLHFATESEALSTGLLDQIAAFQEEYPDLCLVVIDTLQMVRSSTRDYSYSADYKDVSELKQFADEHGITILIIHHTRKMGDSDVMNTVSGTTAINGAADFTWILRKNSRDSKEATLSITGRDVEQRELQLRFTDYRWVLLKDTPFEKLEESKVPECVLEAIDFITANGSWEGTTRALMEAADVEGVSPAAFGKRLAQHSKFMRSRGVIYSKVHTKSGSLLTLELEAEDDGSDSSDGYFDGRLFPVIPVTPVTS